MGTVISETQSHLSLSWQIDTDIQRDGPGFTLENNNARDMMTEWIKSQTYLEREGCVFAYHCYHLLFDRLNRLMPPRKKADGTNL